MKFIAYFLALISILTSSISAKAYKPLMADVTSVSEAIASVESGSEVSAVTNGATVNCVVLSEPDYKITAFSVYAEVGGKKTLLTKGDTVGEYRLCTFSAVSASKITVKIESASEKTQLSVTPSFFEAKKRDFRVASYYVCNADNMSIKACPEYSVSTSTEIILFGLAEFDENGDIKITNENKISAFMSQLKKANPALKITLNLLSSGVGGDDWDTHIENRNALCKGAMLDNRDKFIANIMEVANKYGFDGVHFDWEYPTTSSAKAVFSQFVVALKSSLGEKTLNAALTEWCCNFSKKAIEAIDNVEVMCYDAFDDNHYHATFNSAVYSVSEFIRLGYPKEKLSLGLPFYGRELSGDAVWPSYAAYAKSLGEFNNIAETDNGKCYFNCRAMITDKTAYAYYSELGGVMIWHMSCDVNDSKLSLYKAIEGVIN